MIAEEKNVPLWPVHAPPESDLPARARAAGSPSWLVKPVGRLCYSLGARVQ